MPSTNEGRARLYLLGAMFPLCLAGCATNPQNAASASAQTVPAQQAAATSGERKICRDVSTTGSYGSRHECHTRAEWQQIDELS